MECKEYLRKYRTLRLAIVRLENKIEVEKGRATRITSILSDMPRGGMAHPDDLWVRLVDTKNEYEEKLRVVLHQQEEIEDFVSRIPNDMSRLLLQLRYIDCLSWSEIADLVHYEKRHVLRLHGTALNEARKIYERRPEDDNSVQHEVCEGPEVEGAVSS